MIAGIGILSRMDTLRAFETLGISLGLGMLVGLQRERSQAIVAGIRTFPMISLLGTLCAMLADSFQGWILAAGVVAVVACAAIGNAARPAEDRGAGITTEIAMLVMYAVGALLWTAPWSVGVAVGGATAVLLHAKAMLHRFAGTIADRDFRAIMQFVLITLVILPVVPDRAIGPWGVLNPQQIWLTVVLVVGISLGGYLAYRVAGERAGTVLSGLLGGLISSTATTVSFARRAAEHPEARRDAVVAILLATGVMHGRLLVEIGVVAPGLLARLGGPIGVMMAASLALALLVMVRTKSRPAPPPSQQNPTQLGFALAFAAIYALVLLGVAAAQGWSSGRGLYVIAAISGLTEMDAITLSTARLADGARLAPDQAWRAILVASMANLVFKSIVAAGLGGRRFARALVPLLMLELAASAALLWFWP